jgi:N-acetylglucosamine PTS system EIICBA or EIICB component
MKTVMSNIQQLGRALMLPIAVLPAAALLLRLGQPDWIESLAPAAIAEGGNLIAALHATLPFIAAAGGALFSHLGILFAMGVAVGFAREGHGAAALAGVVGYFVTLAGAEAFLTVPPDVLAGVPDAYAGLVADQFRDGLLSRVHVPVGILCGVTAGVLYNRFHDIDLPDYLAFFGGRRFVPIAAAGTALVYALLLGLSVETIVGWMEDASRAVLDAGGVGLFIYGILNRLLIVTGLHHILNNLAWFQIGDFNGVAGDLNRFFAGDPTAGSFMSGFFPVMMFGLPAACFAMYRQALPARRKEVAGMLGSMALTSFLTGVTEPIEFTFMFLAPVLYAVHAVLTGISMALMDWLGVKLGFGFSAGLFDYVINFGGSTRPLLLIPVGIAYFALYYVIFSVTIRVFNLATPGREPVTDTAATAIADSDTGAAFVAALGGAENLVSVGACTTRLRLEVANAAALDEARLRALGAKGFVKPSANTVQVIIGPTAERVADQIRQALGASPAPAVATTTPASARIVALPQALADLLGALEARLVAGNRLVVETLMENRPDEAALARSGLVPVDAGKGDDAQYLVTDRELLTALKG